MANFTRVSLDSLFNNATTLPEGRVDYSNLVRINVGMHDVVLDFFQLSPNVKSDEEPRVIHIQRMILPLSIAKETGEILLNSLVSWEETFGVTLPFVAAPEPEHEVGQEEEK